MDVGFCQRNCLIHSSHTFDRSHPSLVNLSLFKLFISSWPLKFSNNNLSFFEFYSNHIHHISCCFSLFHWQKTNATNSCDYSDISFLWVFSMGFLINCPCWSLCFDRGTYRDLTLCSYHCHLSQILLWIFWLV